MRKLVGSRLVVGAGVCLYVAAGVRVTEWLHARRWHPDGVGLGRCQAMHRCPEHTRVRRERERGAQPREPASREQWRLVA